jgi:RNA polymerase sigma-70 factor (ECF subfamily)
MPSPAPTAEPQGVPGTVAPGLPGLGPEQLFETHLSFVWRNLRRLGVPEAIVEDAAQDVFLVVHRRWDTWEAGRSTVETWLFGIVLRVAHNHRRTQRRRLAWLLPAPDRALRETPSHADGPIEILAQREALVIFERVLAAIDPDKRAIFLMVDVEGLTVPETAATLGINLNTAYWRLGKARAAFHRALAKLGRPADGGDGRNRP